MISIVPISKEEAMLIRQKLRGVFITKPTAAGRRYMEEADAALRVLQEIREGKYQIGRTN